MADIDKLLNVWCIKDTSGGYRGGEYIKSVNHWGCVMAKEPKEAKHFDNEEDARAFIREHLSGWIGQLQAVYR